MNITVFSYSHKKSINSLLLSYFKFEQKRLNGCVYVCQMVSLLCEYSSRWIKIYLPPRVCEATLVCLFIFLTRHSSFIIFYTCSKIWLFFIHSILPSFEKSHLHFEGYFILTNYLNQTLFLKISWWQLDKNNMCLISKIAMFLHTLIAIIINFVSTILNYIHSNFSLYNAHKSFIISFISIIFIKV